MSAHKNRIILSLLFSMVLIACSKDQPADVSDLKNITIAVSKTPLSTPFYVAMNNNYFSELGLNIKIDDTIGGHRCLQKVLDGQAEFSTVSDYPIMINSFLRNDYQILATFASSTNDVKLLYRPDSGINKPEDLKGKKIGTITGASSHYFVDRFLLLHGIKNSDVKIVHTNPEDMPAAIDNKTVDALSAWEPFGYLSKQRLKNKLNIFTHIDVYRETFNLVSNKSIAQQDPETINKILKALNRSIDFIHKNPTQAQQILKQHLQLDDDFIHWVWEDIEFSLGLDNYLIITLEQEARWAIENQLAGNQAMPNYLDFVDITHLSKVNPHTVTLSR